MMLSRNGARGWNLTEGTEGSRYHVKPFEKPKEELIVKTNVPFRSNET